MAIKQYFMPTKLKVILTAILFFLPLIIQHTFFFTRDNLAYGFPLPFIQRVTYQCIVGSHCPEPSYVFYAFDLILDIITLYLIILLVIFVFERLGKITKNSLIKSLTLALLLFAVFTIISLVFSVGYPSMKAMAGIGLPLVFYAYDPWTGLGVQPGSFFLLEFLLIDVLYWYIVSILIIWVSNRFGIK